MKLILQLVLVTDNVLLNIMRLFAHVLGPGKVKTVLVLLNILVVAMANVRQMVLVFVLILIRRKFILRELRVNDVKNIGGAKLVK
jgi:hypothetical protein